MPKVVFTSGEIDAVLNLLKKKGDAMSTRSFALM